MFFLQLPNVTDEENLSSHQWVVTTDIQIPKMLQVSNTLFDVQCENHEINSKQHMFYLIYL